MSASRYQQGDTIIEVLFAITIFSLIAVGGISLMNQGTALAQQSLEIGLVRQQMDSQADALRYLNRAYVTSYGKGNPATDKWVAIWTKIASDKKVQAAQDFSSIANNVKCNQPPKTAFALNLEKLDSEPLLSVFNISEYDPQKNKDKPTPTYSQIRYDYSVAESEGLWVEAVRSYSQASDQPGYYDFHIRACWQSPGQERPITLGTIVRLYDPAPSK